MQILIRIRILIFKCGNSSSNAAISGDELVAVNNAQKKYDKLQASILSKSLRFLRDLEQNAHKRLLCVCFQALATLASNNEEARRAISDNADLVGKLVDSIQLNAENLNANVENAGASDKQSATSRKIVRTIFYDITDNENNAAAKNVNSEDDEDEDDEDEDDDDDDEDDINTESSSFDAYFSSNEVEMSQDTTSSKDVDDQAVCIISYYGTSFFTAANSRQKSLGISFTFPFLDLHIN